MIKIIIIFETFQLFKKKIVKKIYTCKWSFSLCSGPAPEKAKLGVKFVAGPVFKNNIFA